MQSRGKWMIPAYKAVLFTSFGCSMYMMGRLVLVCPPRTRADDEAHNRRGTRRGSARTNALDRWIVVSSPRRRRRASDGC